MEVGVLSKCAVEKGSVSVVGVFKCSFCPCVFSSDEDLGLHMVAFGSVEVEHVRRFGVVHQVFEGGIKRVVVGCCVSSGKRRPVFDAMDSRVLCRGCRYFRGSFPE